MEIYVTIPFSLDLNLGRAYNDAMEALPADGWACFLDHDAMFTTREWYRQLLNAARAQPSALFTCVTNRIANPWQIASEADPSSNDFAYHRRVGYNRLARRTALDVTNCKRIGGMLLLVSKKTWHEAGRFRAGMACVDRAFHSDVAAAGRKVLVIEGLYVYHFRGTCGTSLEPQLPRAAGYDAQSDHETVAAPPQIMLC